jgi:hypothetical protein
LGYLIQLMDKSKHGPERVTHDFLRQGLARRQEDVQVRTVCNL